ncbi:hypothetical protein [Dactylosporangium sp. CA-092794]|uniref:hypothetical protein n=1 Tax=Dactylosporangium sp. CA-092794 TaxID=3239929 RepID=UPI003D8ACDB1
MIARASTGGPPTPGLRRCRLGGGGRHAGRARRADLIVFVTSGVFVVTLLFGPPLLSVVRWASG